MSDLLHIKDTFYFEVPKQLWRSEKSKREEFPSHFVRNDSGYQDWEALRLYESLGEMKGLEGVPTLESLTEEYAHWRHGKAHHGKPFDRFLEEADSQSWFQEQLALGRFSKQQSEIDKETGEEVGETSDAWRSREASGKTLQEDWRVAKAQAENLEAYYSETPAWGAEKIREYNDHLDGKILIPQPFGKLQNNYQVESGFGISKFMILMLLIAGAIVWAFSRLSKKVENGRPAKGKLWNMFETFLLFIRDEIARPAIGKHDADRFVPLLWTIFLFVLGCNLLGMLPWLGAPTGSFSVTMGLALVTFATVIVAGSIRFGIVGFWKNQVPSMGLPLPLAIPIVPMLFLIEVLGLFIKHAVLGVRLVANMVAGHLVLLAIMGLAVAAAGTSTWFTAAPIAIIGSALFSVLELFVAFLQAYVFTFLSALFIGSAVHHH
ncbi:F0F1 ATP synthase subunit A [Adhaeretor mobilis]|uniref:ATP synthase subunit a n=1 Tax=Adhaeretor mobilis TaxID=1930276 RepID=A0A517MXU3_9BACT|nr:F0F1 ATP synthase subunit A [Adhaeretor mobilis]QDS99691.1 ATP synthase subunit a [Adhaeretor mobilis]